MLQGFILFVGMFALSLNASEINSFTFKSGSYRGYYILKINDARIYLQKAVGNDEVIELLCNKEISSNTLAHINSTLIEIGVNKWKAVYTNPNIKDGHFFKLNLRFSNLQLDRSGYNKYPINYSKLIGYINELTLLNGCGLPYNKSLN